MKKFLVCSLMIVLGVTSFGRGYQQQRNSNRGQQNNHCAYYDSNERREYRMSPEFEKARISFTEKRLEIRKELIKDKPDWTKIQKLNQELALKRAEFRTANMKKGFEYKNSLTKNTK